MAVALVAYVQTAAGAQDAVTNIYIGKTEVGASPADFDLLPSGNGKQGQWKVVHDTTASAGIAIEQAGVEAAEDDRVLFSRVTNGVFEEIAGVDADIASRTWHTLEVRARDNEFLVSLDGTWMFTVFDKTLPHAGRVALWTKGDSVTRFDSITITPLTDLEQRY